MVKIGCTSAKLISKLQALLSVCTIFASQAKIGCTSAKLTSKLAISALGLHYLYPQNSNRKTANKLHLRRCENLFKHQTMKSFVHITSCTLCPSAKPAFACVEGTRFTPPSSVNELIFTFNSASPSCIRVRRRIMS